MCPPACERLRLNTASCCRSSRSSILTSKSRIDGTEASSPTLSSFARGFAKTAGGHCSLGAQDGQVLRRARSLPFPRAVLADRARTRVGWRELDQVLSGETRVSEPALLRLSRLVLLALVELPGGVS